MAPNYIPKGKKCQSVYEKCDKSPTIHCPACGRDLCDLHLEVGH
jgi:hypothetical protein